MAYRKRGTSGRGRGAGGYSGRRTAGRVRRAGARTGRGGARSGARGRSYGGRQQTVRLVIEQVPASGVPGAIDAATGAMTAPSRLRKARF